MIYGVLEIASLVRDEREQCGDLGRRSYAVGGHGADEIRRGLVCGRALGGDGRSGAGVGSRRDLLKLGCC